MTYEPQHLKRWSMPDSYFGAVWPNHYSAGVGQSRDSDCLERSNFICMVEALGGESDVITIVRESHWAVGWVEWIAIEADGTAESDKALQTADEIVAALSDYPVISDEHYSELEWNEAADYWDGLSPREKVKMAMWERERYHWLKKESVWRFGRMDYSALANDGTTIAEALYESLRRC